MQSSRREVGAGEVDGGGGGLEGGEGWALAEEVLDALVGVFQADSMEKRVEGECSEMP